MRIREVSALQVALLAAGIAYGAQHQAVAAEGGNGPPKVQGTQVTTQPKFAVDRELFPFEPHWLRLKNGAVVHYLDEGDGPVLLLLHGNPTWSFLYRKIIPGLKGQFRLIAPDYPGFGLSTAPEGYGFTAAEQVDAVAELVDKLGLRDYSIMMQDWGGPIGFAVALRHPERVRGFVIGNTLAWPLMRTGQHAFSRLMGGPVGQAMAGCCHGVVRTFMKIGVETRIDAKVLEMYLAPFEGGRDRAPTHIFPRELRSAEPFLAELYKSLAKLSDKPALIVWGERDFAFQEGERKRFEQLFPNHKTVILQNAGHFIQEDAPDEIVMAIKSFESLSKARP